MNVRTLPGKRIGFFFQCYRQRSATEFVLANVRKVYPESPITLISDGGDDFAGLAAECGCHYRYGFQTGDGRSTRFPTAGHALAWLDRLASALEDHKANGCEWTMLLEDDVWVRGPVREPATDFAGVHGATWNQPWAPGTIAVYYFILTRHPDLPLTDRYGGCGGTLLRIKTTAPAIRQMTHMPDFKRLFGELGQLAHSDILLTTALGLAGIAYSVSPCHADGGDSQRPEATVIHGYKAHYES